MAQLGKDDIVAMQVLVGRGESKSSVARRFGVSEGTVRYHIKRKATGAQDGRKKQGLIEQQGLEDAIGLWWQNQVESLPADRPPCVDDLHRYLMAEHGYQGSYRSVLRYVRKTFTPPKLRPFRRVETPPGAQTQSDWAERKVDIGNGPQDLYAFLMVLSHSRKKAVIWSQSCDQLAWHHVHNEAFKRLGGIPAVNRIDNLKTGISRGAGAWGDVNPKYQAYARHMRFHVEAHQARQPQQKGKVERQVQVVDRLGLQGRFSSLEHLQAWTDEMLEAEAQRRKCPATGLSVHESWEAEKDFLQPLPETLPEPFNLVKSCPVHKDSTIRAEGHTYAVPFAYVGRHVEVFGTARKIHVCDPDTGALLIEYPRHSRERILIDQRCYEGPSTDRVSAPLPLGRMARKLQEIAALPVEQRPIDLYAALAEVAL